MTELGAPRSVTLPTKPATVAMCPYLLAADGRSRASNASRDHRCTAVAPAAILATEKQRRLCLVADHLGCSTYTAATAVHGTLARPSRVRPTTRPLTRTTPVMLDQGRLSRLGVPALPQRHVGQGGLVALMAVAFGALAVARLSVGGPELRPSVVNGASASPAVTVSAEPAAGATSDPVSPTSDLAGEPAATPERTLVPSEVDPTAPPPDASPAPAGAKTYTIKRGDTLSGVAGSYGITWQALAELNGITDPGRLRIGQVLQLP